ncbi:hypothetical protein SELMODRAFT_78094 [Selaginella moellendorffii]|uniref:Amino acid transporter transmembrane domain-containing protein n=1 Tax=Selaginella moellendorffii TaxID=88036 RepID=D8QUL6_SELML|nr:auxin transporter-like protein 1 [Selaginella moellendorffii]EFJ35892.1 hypothetical protein SELMODRAFT_78094 [Selaginella moellendorffii]|eukprot:XP_002962429.1 auxin transporter-like protein 1 [Selaginella moellendorffii]
MGSEASYYDHENNASTTTPDYSSPIPILHGKAGNQSTGNDQQEQHHQDHAILSRDDSWFGTFKSIFWHGGSAFDAWLNATSTQIAQVLLTFPYSFAQLGLASGIVFQLLYGFMGCWTCYMITSLYADYRAAKEKENPKAFEKHTIQWYEVLGGLLGPYWRAAGIFFNTALLFCTATIQVIACGSTVYYINDSLPKRTWTIIFGACCIITVLIPTAHNYRVLSFTGILMTTYTAWYLTIAAGIHDKVPNVTHSGPKNIVQYFTGATNILYAFGGHAVTVEIMHAMWKPRKFKLVYLYAILYIFTLTLPSAITVYWRFGDTMLHSANAFGVFPKNKFRDAAVILMLMHQFIEFGLIGLPVFLIWEKFLGVHHSKYYILRAIARIPVVLAIWFIAIMIPFFGPINSAVGSLLVTFSVYLIPCAAHMVVNSKSTARKAAIEQPPRWIRSWTVVYVLNSLIIVWVVIVGFGFGVYASVKNLVDQIDTFGLFARCYQCPKKH